MATEKYYLDHTGAQLDAAIAKVLSGELNVPLQEKTVTPTTSQQIVTPDKEYKGLSKVTVHGMPSANLATPTISVGADGLITVVMTQPAGYVSAQTTTTTYQLPTHEGGEYENIPQTVTVAGKFMTGDIVIIRAEPTYTVEARSGASYGFTMNSSGYYESTNKGKNGTYAICRVTINAPMITTAYFDCINYAETNYDYGIIGLVDTDLALSTSADSSYTCSFKGSSSSSVQRVTMTIPAGTHFVDVKFIKDGSQSSNNDSLQFKVSF